jgi:hypothetical protein
MLSIYSLCIPSRYKGQFMTMDIFIYLDEIIFIEINAHKCLLWRQCEWTLGEGV